MNTSIERRSYNSNEMVEFILKNGFIDKMETLVVDYGCRAPEIQGNLKNSEIDSYFYDLLAEKRLTLEHQTMVSDFCYTPFVKGGEVYLKEYISFDRSDGFDGENDLFYNDVFDFLNNDLLSDEVVEHLESTVEEFEYYFLNFTITFTDKTFELGSIDYNSEKIILNEDQQQHLYEFMRDLFIESNSSYLHFLPSGITVSFDSSENCSGEKTSEIKLQESILWVETLVDNKTWIFNEEDLLKEHAKVLIEVGGKIISNGNC